MGSTREAGALAVGAVVGNYRLTRRLGEGGMGIVFLAEHRVLRRQVAIKVLRPAFSKIDELVTRFFEEARITSTIGHRGVATVYDTGTTGSGLAYFVMEPLAGETLRDHLSRRGRCSPRLTLAIASGVASVLVAAHSVGIVHRDIKPENVFLLADEDDAVVGIKVLDFGIAKFESNPAKPLSSTSVSVGAILGTPSYMSPEQCCGGAIDHRADLYSLGCLAFEMLAGVPPFLGDSAEVIFEHLHAIPPRAMASIPGIGSALDDLIGRLLAKSPEQRPATAQAVLDALESIESKTRWPTAHRDRFTGSPATRSSRIAIGSSSASAVAIGSMLAYNCCRSRHPLTRIRPLAFEQNHTAASSKHPASDQTVNLDAESTIGGSAGAGNLDTMRFPSHSQTGNSEAPSGWSETPSTQDLVSAHDTELVLISPAHEN